MVSHCEAMQFCCNLELPPLRPEGWTAGGPWAPLLGRRVKVRLWQQVARFRGRREGAVCNQLALGNGTPLQYSCLENPWTEEPGRLQSMGSLRVGHDCANPRSLSTFTHWRRKWQPTPVFLPGESQGRGSLVGCHLWGRTESDTTEAT